MTISTCWGMINLLPFCWWFSTILFNEWKIGPIRDHWFFLRAQPTMLSAPNHCQNWCSPSSIWSRLASWWYMADSRPAPSQWETSLQSNAVSDWLDATLESALMELMQITLAESGEYHSSALDNLHTAPQLSCHINDVDSERAVMNMQS